MTVRDIVHKHLTKIGAAGLCNTDAECGCGIEDFPCCDSYMYNCVPAKAAWDEVEKCMTFRPMEVES